jgi:hypothetical protein
MSATKELYFEPIDFEGQKRSQPGALNYETTVREIKNGKKVNTHEETGFILTQYSGLAPKEIKTAAKTISFKSHQRNFIKIPIIPEQQTCLELENQINRYDDALSENSDATFGTYKKLFTHIRSIKEPTATDDLDVSVNPDKPLRPKYKSCKLRLEMGWNYYLDEQILDDKNSSIVRNAFFDAKKRKVDPQNVVVKLNLTDDEGNEVKRDVKIGEIEQVKDKILTKVMFRRPESIPEDAKPVEHCSEKELVKYYGKGEPITVNTPDELDKYYRNNCYIRVVYEPLKVYAQRAKGDDGKRKCSFIFQIKLIDIVNTRQHTNSSESNKQFEHYAFRSHVSDNEIEKENDTTDTTTTTTTTTTAKKVVVDDDVDDVDDVVKEEEEVVEEGEVDGEEQEEDDDEPVVETKAKGRSKVVVEQPKTKPVIRKTK